MCIYGVIAFNFTIHITIFRSEYRVLPDFMMMNETKEYSHLTYIPRSRYAVILHRNRNQNQNHTGTQQNPRHFGSPLPFAAKQGRRSDRGRRTRQRQLILQRFLLRRNLASSNHRSDHACFSTIYSLELASSSIQSRGLVRPCLRLSAKKFKTKIYHDVDYQLV